MNLFDLVGYLAAAMVFMAFYMKDMVVLRIMALASNVTFLIYALGLDLVPVAVLHLALIPVNCWRLWEIVRRRDDCVDDLGNGGTLTYAQGASAPPRGKAS
jgi:hypothetical protein